MNAGASSSQPAKGGQPRVLLIDGHAHAYRAFHGIRELRSPLGEPTNALFGFKKALDRHLAFVEPTHAAVVWDGGLDTVRVADHPGYKADRPPMPADLDSQMSGLRELVGALGIRSLEWDGVEADDAIATLAVAATQSGMEVVIASHDKDFMQLVGPGVTLVNSSDKELRHWRDAEVVAKTGILPGQVVDWLSLVGDSVDNIEGAPGIGPKTATRLLTEHRSLDRMLSGEVSIGPDRIRDAVAGCAERLRRNQKLIRLRTDLDLGLGPLELALQSADVKLLDTLFARWGFQSMRKPGVLEPAVQPEFALV